MSAYAQVTEIEADYSNTPLEQVLKDVETHFNLRVSYQSEVVANKMIDLNGSYTLAEIIAAIESQSGVSIDSLDDTNLVLTRGNSGEFLDLSGQLLDSNTGEPISYATIRIKDAPRGVITDAEGVFTFTNVPKDAFIVIEHIGYAPLEQPVSDFNEPSLCATSMNLAFACY